ncbi:MAG: hypothetical protein GY719_30010 [bacterium]|nr:hypothetical protein [bacterium]
MTERSRAYPVLSLEDGGTAVGEILDRLGDGSYSREVLAEVLGHSNARGGPGARKIAALTQYGFLNRKAGLYSPTSLAASVVWPADESQRQGALLRALRHPPLFEALLDRYEPQGRLPEHLDGILWRDHGITRKASTVAAEMFRRSARYAGVLDEQGALRPARAAGASRRDGLHSGPTVAGRALLGAAPVRPDSGAGRAGRAEQRFEFALTGGRVAKLCLPLELCRRDLDIVRKQIEFLEYQVEEKD